ncbi:hypothetical protein [Streptomyces sp. NPDC002853]
MLLYEGGADEPDAYRGGPGPGDDPYERELRERDRRERDLRADRERSERAWAALEPDARERLERELHTWQEDAREDLDRHRAERERRERELGDEARRERERALARLDRLRLEREREQRRQERSRLEQRRRSGPPPVTRALRDSLTRWPDSLFHAEPDRVLLLSSTSVERPSWLRDAVRDTRDLLLVHYAGALDTGVLDGAPGTRRGLPLLELLDVLESASARHVVVVLEPDWQAETPHEGEFHHRYAHLTRRSQGRLTLIVAEPFPGYSRSFLADALGGDSPLTAHTLAAHPRARVLLRADGRDVRLTGSGRPGGREPVARDRARALNQSLARTRSALAKARDATGSALSASAPLALLLLAVAMVAGGLFALLRALPPLRGTWGAAVLLGLWAVLAVIGIVSARLRTPPARGRPPGKASTASPVPRGRAFADGVFAAWGFSGPLAATPARPPQPVPARPTREESRAAVERSLSALYARLPVPQMRAPDPPTPPASPASPAPSPSPDDNGTTP